MNYRQHAKGAALCFAAAATVFLLFAQPGACRAAAAEALALCGAPLLLGVYPFLIVSNLIAGSGAAPVLAVPLRPGGGEFPLFPGGDAGGGEHGGCGTGERARL